MGNIRSLKINSPLKAKKCTGGFNATGRRCKSDR